VGGGAEGGTRVGFGGGGLVARESVREKKKKKIMRGKGKGSRQSWVSSWLYLTLELIISSGGSQMAECLKSHGESRTRGNTAHVKWSPGNVAFQNFFWNIRRRNKRRLSMGMWLIRNATHGKRDRPKEWGEKRTKE